MTEISEPEGAIDQIETNPDDELNEGTILEKLNEKTLTLSQISACSDDGIDVDPSNVDESKEKDKSSPGSERDVVKKRLRRLIDTDSEDDTPVDFELKRSTTNEKESRDVVRDTESKSFSKNKNSRRIIDSDFEDESSTSNDVGDDKEENSEGMPFSTKAQNMFQTLIDTDSEDEGHRSPLIETTQTKAKVPKKRELKTRKISLRAAKDEAMKQIHSETQRLLRESQVSLPYHRPKQRSLEEFLNRKKVFTTLPKAPTMAAKLKMSSAIVNQVLEEKEKEAEIFYKSSESEDEIEQCLSDKETTDDNEKRQTSTNIQDVDTKDAQETAKAGPDLSAEKPNEDATQPAKPSVQRKLFHANEEPQHLDAADKPEAETIEENDVDKLELTVRESKRTPVVCTEIVDSAGAKDKEGEFGTPEPTEDLEASNATNRDELLQKSGVDLNKSLISANFRNDIENSEEEEPGPSAFKINDDYAKMVKESLGINADDADDYNEYGLPPPSFSRKKLSNIKDKELENVLNLKPKLKGLPGTVIDLSNATKPNKEGINGLIDRFFCKHSTVTNHSTDTSTVTATHVKDSPGGLSIVKETLPYKAPVAAIEDPKLSKPGAKLMHLRQELKHKIAMKRDEEWKRKEEEMKEHEKLWNESENEEDVLSDAEFSDKEIIYSEDEEDLIEDDVCMKEKKRKNKCAFVEDEADVSEDEDANGDDENEQEDDEDEEEDEDDSRDSNNSLKNRKLKRIINLPDDDSNLSRDSFNQEGDIKESAFPRTRTDVDMFDTDNGNEVWSNDNEIDSQPHVPNALRDPCQTPRTKANDSLNLVSPATQLTALNAYLDSGSKERSKDDESSFDRPFQLTCDFEKKPNLQKKLFDDPCEPATEEDLLQLCSGQFTFSQKTDLGLSRETNISDSQLLSLCSGSFSTQANDRNKLEDNGLLEKENTSRDARSSEENRQQVCEPALSCNLRVVSSDEDDDFDAGKVAKKRTKKKVRKLELSDDEVASSEEEEDDEERFIDYDSEENEVVVAKKDLRQYAAGFLEEEAELSESDWEGSADEDEKGLDKLEYEAVDDEDLDENQVKSQLERMHMKQVLDEDQREVRMLQELLFEDGDLHSDGSGRERKFKWRNINKQGEEDESPHLTDDKDGWVDLSEDEDEVKWRKLRHERDKFVAEKMKDVNSLIENDLNTSQIFKLGVKAIKKINVSRPESQNTPTETVEPRIPHTISEILDSSSLEGHSRVIHSVMKKRSILAKGEASLARIATMAKQRDSTVLRVKHRNFVFEHIDPIENDPNKVPEETKGKKEVDLSNKYRKRKSGPDAGSRPFKRSKVGENFTKGKRY